MENTTQKKLTSQPLVSVIIPCYNTEQYVAEALESVLAQTLSNFEVIVMDDGSIDNTWKVLQDYAKKDERIRIFSQKNQNVTWARVNAIQHAKGQYLFFLDSDDKIAPVALAEFSDYLNQNPDISVVYSKSEYFEAWHGEIWSQENPVLKDILLRHCLGVGPSVMVRKSDYALVGGYDTNLTYGEDWDLYISLLKHGKKFYQIPKVLFFYRIRNNKSSITNTADGIKISENFLKIYTKHHLLYQEYDLFLHVFFENTIKLISYQEKEHEKEHELIHLKQSLQELNVVKEQLGVQIRELEELRQKKDIYIYELEQKLATWNDVFYQQKRMYYQKPFRKWFYRIFKSKKYLELKQRFNLD